MVCGTTDKLLLLLFLLKMASDRQSFYPTSAYLPQKKESTIQYGVGIVERMHECSRILEHLLMEQ